MTEIPASYGVPLTPELLQEARLIGELLDKDFPAELSRALGKHGPPLNGHEVFGNITEERDEFFDLVKADASCLGMYEQELLHVAVTAIRGAAMYRRMRKGLET